MANDGVDPGRPARRPTLKDVAAAAGVSYQTVSRVINGDPRVRARTRSAVEAVVAALAYEPSAAARALVTGRSHILGVLVEDLGQYGPSGTVQGLDGAAKAAGWDLALASVPARAADDVAAAMSSLRRRGARAVTLVCGAADVVEAALRHGSGLPLIGTTQGFDALLTSSVEIGQREGVRLAIEHLLALGRRRIAHIAGPPASLDAALRAAEVRRLLAAADLEPVAVVHGDWSARSGAAAAGALSSAAVDGLFVANDQMALGALSTLRASGRRVPEDVAIVGFDDVPEAAFYVPPLTTVRQDFVALGAAVIDVLEDVLEGSGDRRVTIRPELVIRASSVVSAGSSAPPRPSGRRAGATPSGPRR